MKPKVYRALDRWMVRIYREDGPHYSMWTRWEDAIARAIDPWMA